MKKPLKELYELFSSIKDEKEAKLLLEDILTPAEIDFITERWQIVQLLAQGIPQREVATKLGTSISKVTRGSRMLKYGSGGFKIFLKRLF